MKAWAVLELYSLILVLYFFFVGCGAVKNEAMIITNVSCRFMTIAEYGMYLYGINTAEE